MIASSNVRVRISSAWKLAVVFSVLLLSVGILTTHAQDIFGTINGTVSDTSNALVPGAHVTLINEATGVARTVDANGDGFFSFSDIPVGTYTVEVRMDKFRTFRKTGITLNAGAKVAADATLQLGATTEVVTVVGTGVTLQKDSGEISRVVDFNEIQHLTLSERNYIAIVQVVPGFALAQGGLDQTGLTTSQNLAQGNFNGLRGDGSLYTVDGVFNMDGGSNGTQINNVGIDFIQELNVQTSSYSAEYGRSTAASVDVVTRSGGDRYHGTLYENIRNNAVDASPDNLTAREVGAAELRFNDFGGAVGGPVPGFLRGKLFFFGGIEAKRLVVAADGQRNLALPTSYELAGNFCDEAGEACNSLAAPVAKTTFPLTNGGPVASGGVPGNCIGYYSGGATDTTAADFVANGTALSAPGTVFGTALNPSCISGAGKAIAAIYTLMEKPGGSPESAVQFSNVPTTTSNSTFLPSTPQNWEEDMFRLDYHPSAKHADYFRFIHDHLLLVDPFGIFAPGGAQLPTAPSLRNRPGYSVSFGDVWTPNSHFVNEARFSVGWNKQRIPLTGNVWQESTYGFVNSGAGANYLEPYGNVGPFPTGIPTGTYSNCPTSSDANECPAQFYGPYNFLLAPTVDIEPSEAVTIIVRSHTLKFGVDVFRNRKDQNSRDNSTQGSLNFSLSNPNSSNNSFADSLLGNYNSLGQFNNDPIGHFRFTGYEGYANDDWRVSRILSVELGVRYEYTVPTYTQGNNMVNWVQSDYNPVAGLVVCGPSNEAAGQVCNPGVATSYDPTGAKLATNVVVNTTANAPAIMDCAPPPSNPQAGGACSNGGFFVNGLVRTGNVPSDQAQRVPGAYNPFVLDVPAGGPRGFFKAEGLFGPRAGFALTPMKKLVVRGGFGIYYDKPEGNLVFGQTASVPYLQSISYSFGNMGVLPSSGVPVPTALGPGSINPGIRVARVEQYNFGLQYQLPDKILLQAAYSGNYGWHELREPQINVASYASALTFAPVGGNAITQTQAAPFQGFGGIQQFQSDAYSDYNALQISAAKTTGLITTQVSYTYSKTLETNASEGDNPWPMCAFSCVVGGQTVNWQRYYYGLAAFDIRNNFVTSFAFNDPLFRDGKGLRGETLGGWTLSGIIRAQGGFPLTATAGTNVQEGDFVGGSLVACPVTGSGGAACLSGTETNRAFFVSGQSVSPGVGNTSCAAGSGLCYFNTAAFTSVGMSTGVGTSPIGAIIGPGLLGMDVSVRKNFSLAKEGYGLAVQFDANSVLNHPNLGNPNTTVTSSSFGRITSVVGGSQRQFQLDFKFTF